MQSRILVVYRLIIIICHELDYSSVAIPIAVAVSEDDDDYNDIIKLKFVKSKSVLHETPVHISML